jgi:hypothetical protein
LSGAEWSTLTLAAAITFRGSMAEIDDEARAFMIARQLIDQHGEEVGTFLQTKIDSLSAAQKFEELAAWFVIRNAVALVLGGDATLH